MSTETTSRWWYGVAALPVLAILLYLLAFIVIGTRNAMTTSDPALILNVLGAFGVFVVGLIILLLTVLFSASLLLDIRTIRKSPSEWSPSWAYGFIAVVHLLNLVFPVLWLVVSVPGAVLYLYRRHKYLGVP